MKLESHFGEDVILTGIRGKRKVVTSRSTAEKILERFLKSAKEKKKGGGGEWSIQIAAKLLLVNINNTETSKEYASGAKVAELAANLDYIPHSLLFFIFLLLLLLLQGKKER